MALHVRKLNADSTFLLSFAPDFAPTSDSAAFPGAFTVLVDPWLAGPSSILHRSFQLSYHTKESAITSLAQLEQPPDLIVISQDKPDHCHKDTLRSIPSHWRTPILATPAACKKIRSWKCFDAAIIHEIPPYQSTRPDSLIRISLSAYTSSSAPGELTFANVATKRDIVGVHNAIAITYRPPGSRFMSTDGEVIHLSEMINPNISLVDRKARSAVRVAEVQLNTPPTTPSSRTSSNDRGRSFFDVFTRNSQLATPPASPERPNIPQRTDSGKGPQTQTEKTLSVIYTPHGMPLSALQHYVERHLAPNHALPVTALFHCINTEENPWFMGGRVANGAPTGCELAHGLRAQHWISSHDELKANTGFAVTFMKSKRYHISEVEDMLRQDEGAQAGAQAGTQVHVLSVGEEMRL